MKLLVEYLDVIVGLDSFFLSFERSFKGGDISYFKSVFDLIVKFDDDDGENVIIFLVYGFLFVDSVRVFIIFINIINRFCEIGLWVDGFDIFLIELLEYFFELEIFYGLNQYYCEQCNSLQDVERIVIIVKVFEFLVFIFKRFVYNVCMQQRFKILEIVLYFFILCLFKMYVKDEVIIKRDFVNMEVQDCLLGILEEKIDDIISQFFFIVN